MQTLRKLPTMQPRTNSTTDQKWNGTAAQLCESRIGLIISQGLATTHRYLLPARGACFQPGRAGRSIIRVPWRLGTTTCPGRLPCGSLRLWRVSAMEFQRDDKSYRTQLRHSEFGIASGRK